MPELREPRETWTALLAKLGEDFPDGHRSLPPACTVLLEQAVLAYEAGANEAAVLTCRASLEAACWHYLHIL